MIGVLNIIVALPAEANPIIKFFKLRPIVSEPYKIFASKDHSIRLIISGVGKICSNKAVSMMGEKFVQKKFQAWLNIGIGGHINRPIGSILAAHKITDKISTRSWYPPMNLNFPFETVSMLTVDKEIHDYPEEELVEMEASGFYSASEVFSTHELIHSLKIISDNNLEKNFDGKSVKRMIEKQCENIQSVVNQLLQLSSRLQELEVPSHKLNEFLINWHFSVTQKYELEKILRRWSAVLPNKDPFKIVNNKRISKDVILALHNELEKTPMDPTSL
ncbi:MAG: hypothetical protein CMG75_07985 [Candidatus Marinimicrobia bacterium]|nr:hypothetical protein [Candidatus Neomarinimicrobiota bacterium]|tara:strand:+ start:3029 stop:3853 length:825 start_codon:yes stop_codon:yes gene_type:complete